MKCIQCDEEAKYIINGQSLCDNHKHDQDDEDESESENGKTQGELMSGG